MRLGVFVPLACALQLVRSAAVFNWPDPLLDNIDNHLYVNHFSGISTATLGCAERDLTTVAAQWLRLAFHDFATHNVTEGTGGLDASIIYELDRAQNVGLGQRKTLIDLLNVPTEYTGMADAIAMGAVSAVIGCGGPPIPFRAGRIDATTPGPETVPEPQETLEEHTAEFKRMGFNATEMIALTACGHSLGGIRQIDFPEILTPDQSVGVTFQSPIAFNNSIVHEYLDWTTVNTLEVGPNVSTRSDLRIFSSDNNATMKRLSEPLVFTEVCTDLLARMIDTVPSNVQLTDVVEPIDYKVSDTMLYPQDGSLKFLATLRIIDNRPLVLSFRAPNKTVTMFWKERQGTPCPDAGCSVELLQLDYLTASTYGLAKGYIQFEYYRFKASIPLENSISHFWFEVDFRNGSDIMIVDNHGANYTIEQDILLYDAGRTQFTDAGTTIVAAVKDDFLLPETVYAKTTLAGNPLAPIVVNTSTITHLTRDFSIPPADGYTYYSSPISPKALSNTLHAKVGGQAYSLYLPILSTPGV